jgi:hypothetical protein
VHPSPTARRGRWIAVALGVIALAAGVTAWIATRGGDDGGGQRAAPPASSRASGVRVPEPGTYEYATRGFESVDALLVSSLDYPRTSTIEVSRGGCGIVETWRALAERSAKWSFCLAPGRWRLRRLSDFHSFFGTPLRLRYDCSGPFIPRPAALRAGYRWTDRCTATGARVTAPGTVIGSERIEVGGAQLETVHVRVSARLRGIIEGLSRIDSWLLRANGLLVRRVVRSDTRIRSPIGRAKVRERYRLQLRSVTPGPR